MTKRKMIGAFAMVGLMSMGLVACGKEKGGESKTEPVVVAATEGNEYSVDSINSCDLTYGAVSLRVRDKEGVVKNVLADKDLKVFCE